MMRHHAETLTSVTGQIKTHETFAKTNQDRVADLIT